jgi:hypothetical protein
MSKKTNPKLICASVIGAIITGILAFGGRQYFFSKNQVRCCLLLCAWLGTVNLVRAESLEGNRIVDISALSCADLLRMPLPQALIAVGWIGGFYAGLKNDSRVNVLVFANDADQIIALCRKNESTSVMTLVERTFGLVRPPKP